MHPCRTIGAVTRHRDLKSFYNNITQELKSAGLFLSKNQIFSKVVRRLCRFDLFVRLEKKY